MAPRLPVLALCGLATLACHRGSRPADPDAAPTPSAVSDELAPADGDSDPSGDQAAASPVEPRAPYSPPSTLGAPIETRLARSVRTVYSEADVEAPYRARIPNRETFYVYAHAEPGRGCKAGWALVGESAWTCLSRTELAEPEPEPLPRLLDGSDLPFIYARHQQHRAPETPEIPVYRSLRALNAGAEPVETLPAYGSYAFVRYKWNKGAPALLTATHRAVSAAELHRFAPSPFEGRDLVARPLPAGEPTLAWSIRTKAPVHADPDPESEVLGRLPRLGELYVRGEGEQARDGERWFAVEAVEARTGVPSRRPNTAAQTQALIGGWVRADDLRRWLPVPPDGEPLLGERLLDVDLDQQMLTVWHEREPVFVTLISSGRAGDRTPPGRYRLRTKYAYGKMASLPSADEPYFVEAVPWAMYFSGRYAFHASYWHGRFGQRMSHGCVNLSPRDAKRVFELSTPALAPGWLLVHEHASDPGTQVRVRRAGRTLPDRRRPLGPDPRGGPPAEGSHEG